MFFTLTHHSKASSNCLIGTDTSHCDSVSGNSVAKSGTKSGLTCNIRGLDLLDDSSSTDVFNDGRVDSCTSQKTNQGLALQIMRQQCLEVCRAHLKWSANAINKDNIFAWPG